MDRAGAALRDTAAVFGAGEADLLANDPQERSVGFRFYLTKGAIDVELCHGGNPFPRCLAGSLVVLLRGVGAARRDGTGSAVERVYCTGERLAMPILLVTDAVMRRTVLSRGRRS